MDLLQELLTGDTREANNYREHNREDNSVMEFPSECPEIKFPHINGPCCLRICSQV
jgi:hypothetical protein